MPADKQIVIVPGFHGAGISAGIKTGHVPDLALVYSVQPAVVAGVFTRNSFRAAPVLISQQCVARGIAQAIITNSGNANACTGDQGRRDAVAMAHTVAQKLGIAGELVLVASTGVIGHPLPMDKIVNSLDTLVAHLSPEGLEGAARAIMTTDKWPKIASRRMEIGGKEVTIWGMAKGAGMIQPQMATMLAYLMTDLRIDRATLDRAFRYAVDRTFNAISVDGCMSTNDMVVIMANGLAGNRPPRPQSRDYRCLVETLLGLMEELAKAIVRDGEGATKVVEVVIEEATSRSEAKKLAYAVANANLVKAAFFGQDPNWGRIISAVGSLCLPLDETKVRLYLADECIFSEGVGLPRNEASLREIMRDPEIRVTVKMGRGDKSWRLWTSDLTFDYVKINSHYRT